LPPVQPIASLVPLARCRWTARIAVWTVRAPSIAYATGPRALDRPHRAGPPALVMGPTAPLSTFSNRNSGIEPRPRAIVTAACGLPSSHGKNRQAVTDRQLGCRPCPPLGGLAFRVAREYQRRVSASVEDVAAVVRKPSTALPLGVKPQQVERRRTDDVGPPQTLGPSSPRLRACSWVAGVESLPARQGLCCTE
jgi:hypothetical protein